MGKYVYPAVFTEEDDCFYVNFPDIKNCFTDGNAMADAIENGEDVLSLMLCEMEDRGEKIPTPSNIKTISAAENETVSLVFCDTDKYRRLNDKRLIKKTIMIPGWLNTEAEQAGINFSQTMQNALKQQLNIDA